MSDQIELLPFQVRASNQIVNRFLKLQGDAKRPAVHRGWDVPFYQALAALTGAGKTPILADAVSQIRTSSGGQPIVLWISKAKSVVDQTFANFAAGGKYSHLIDGFQVVYLSDLKPEQIDDTSSAFLALTTVGAFNQRDRSDGTLNIHRAGDDSGEVSLWSRLTARGEHNRQRRPLIIVYDEGHNLSDQQTDLLLDLEPDAILVASATMRTPGRLGRMIDRLKEVGWSDIAEADEKENVRPCLVTAVSSKAVVDAELVKTKVVIGASTTIMESMIDDMIDLAKIASDKAALLHAGFRPKCIYVCRTNVNQDDGSTDVISRPFAQRKAPPILIWRYLVEQKKISPEKIAVYCDLKFDRTASPPPPDFRLFSGGESDFATFSAGEFEHVIFNLSLQEGWDDPACSFAYIDKSMGSSVQIEQIIGRVLRQPGATHYPDDDLNTATFFIRVDDRQEFPAILSMVQAKLGAELPEVRVEGFSNPKDRLRSRLEPKKHLSIPEIHIDAAEALEPLSKRLDGVHDYRPDKLNTAGKGEMVRAVQLIGSGEAAKEETVETPHSNRVTARWVVRRGMLSLYPEAAKAIDWADGRFDAKVEITSPAAANLRSDAEALALAYVENSELVFEEENPFTVGAILVNPLKAKAFKHALHESYDLSNDLEADVADEIDKTGLDWCRNPVSGGYAIPLLDIGDKRKFFPDFLVWKDGAIFAIDPKGGHLLAGDAGKKLLNIQDEKGHRKVLVRFISAGKFDDALQRLGPGGFTVFSATKSTGGIKARHVASVTEAVEAALRS